MAKKEVAVSTAGHMAVSESRPDFLGNGNRGSEGVSVDDLTIPRIDIIQDLSPQRKKDKPEYIDGAEEGMIFNTVSGRLYGSAITIVPVLFRKEWVIWKDRKQGGGFRGAFRSEADAKVELTALEDGAHCEIQDTAQNFVLILTDDDVEEAVISMSRSKMKAARKLNTLIRMGGGDRFSGVYEMAVVSDQNAQGQDYYNWGVKRLGYVSEEAYRRAEGMYEAVQSGERDVNRGSADAEREAETEY